MTVLIMDRLRQKKSEDSWSLLILGFVPAGLWCTSFLTIDIAQFPPLKEGTAYMYLTPETVASRCIHLFTFSLTHPQTHPTYNHAYSDTLYIQNTHGYTHNMPTHTLAHPHTVSLANTLTKSWRGVTIFLEIFISASQDIITPAPQASTVTYIHPLKVFLRSIIYF